MLTPYIGLVRGPQAVGRKELCAVCWTAARGSPVRMTLVSMFAPTSPDRVLTGPTLSGTINKIPSVPLATEIPSLISNQSVE